jgi:hypothetical protein
MVPQGFGQPLFDSDKYFKRRGLDRAGTDNAGRTRASYLFLVDCPCGFEFGHVETRNEPKTIGGSLDSRDSNWKRFGDSPTLAIPGKSACREIR